MKDGPRIARLSSWAFILLCLVSSALGFIVFGILGGAISDLMAASDSIVGIVVLAGIIGPTVALVSIRRHQLRKQKKETQSVDVRDQSPKILEPIITTAIKPETPTFESTLNDTKRHDQSSTDSTKLFAGINPTKAWVVAIIGILIVAIWIYNSSGNKIQECDSPSVKNTLMNGTWEKQRNTQLAEWQSQLGTYQKETFECPSGYPFANCKERFFSHLEEMEKMKEANFNSGQEFFVENINLLKNVSATLVNIRQQKYDRENNIRYCAAGIEYQNVSTELSNAGRARLNCRQVMYKIEPLVEKPDSFYLSWQCD